jgi:hypothetical protein
MTARREILDLYTDLTENYRNGLSNTSTAKFNSWKTKFAEWAGLREEEVYIVSAGTRPGNLPIRLTQGRTTTRKTALGIGVMSADDREDGVSKAKSALNASWAYRDEGRALYDAIGIVCVIDDSPEFLMLKEIESSVAGDNLKNNFPDLEVEKVREVSKATGLTSKYTALTIGTKILDSDMVHQFETHLKEAGIIISNDLPLRFLSSLLTKGFVILTGLSGSGKTKVAHAFAEWIAGAEEQFRIVAVGADWTSNENILGYRDALQPIYYRKPSSGALDVILHAIADPDHPYLLILDEMNLSHVERYFADILSSIESKQEIALHSDTGLLKANEEDPVQVPPRVRLPDNLFIIGTVNVDETTYMFSPKVLDRANVIEFRATKDDIKAFLAAPARVDMSKLAGKGSCYGPDFVKMAAAEVAPLGLPPEIAIGAEITENLKDRLTEIFEKLAPVGAEFGFRTAIEISRFIFYHAILSGSEWDFKDALDAQVIQKLMPKLHGSDRKLRPTLDALKAFCTEYELILSLEKTDRMLVRLKDGFTSFAEA